MARNQIISSTELKKKIVTQENILILMCTFLYNNNPVFIGNSSQRIYKTDRIIASFTGGTAKEYKSIYSFLKIKS